MYRSFINFIKVIIKKWYEYRWIPYCYFLLGKFNIFFGRPNDMNHLSVFAGVCSTGPLCKFSETSVKPVLFFWISGVTDSKAVKGSMSGLDFGGSASSIVVIVTGVAAGLVFTVLLVCLFVTCKKRVSILNFYYFLQPVWPFFKAGLLQQGSHLPTTHPKSQYQKLIFCLFQILHFHQSVHSQNRINWIIL